MRLGMLIEKRPAAAGGRDDVAKGLWTVKFQPTTMAEHL